MVCPVCGSTSRVVETRRNEADTVIERRRQCRGEARHRFSTTEQVLGVVLKTDGERSAQPFDRKKLTRSIKRAAKKMESHQIEDLVASIEREIRRDGSMTARAIGNRVLARLGDVDEVAYIRFASVFNEFSDIDKFVEQVEQWGHERRQVRKSKDTEVDGRPGAEIGLEPFEIAKVERGMRKALTGLKVPEDQVIAAVDRLDAAVRPGEVVTTQRIGELVVDELLGLHPQAAMRFGSVFLLREAKTDEQLEEAFEQLRRWREGGG